MGDPIVKYALFVKNNVENVPGYAPDMFRESGGPNHWTLVGDKLFDTWDAAVWQENEYRNMRHQTAVITVTIPRPVDIEWKRKEDATS